MDTSEPTTEAILRYINEDLLFGDGEALADDDLLETGLLDSIGVFGLVQFVRETYGYEVPPQDILIENFRTASTIVTYLSLRLSEVD
ncbi:MAG: acyl carrier protein [Rhodothermales bacterium]|nr:acyl carrier protein [Rhodothermales bacterium]